MLKVSTEVFGKQPQNQSENHPARAINKKPILWVDGVGGFLLLERAELLIGQAVAGGHQDIGIVGDLSRQAAVIQRIQSDYVLKPIQETCLDGVQVSGPQILSDGAILSWGPRVRTRFIKPHPLSSTARLDLISQHRFQPRVDSVILLADSCILGPSSSCHVHCPQWNHDLLMFRNSDQWYFRALDELEVNGLPASGQIAVASGLRIRGSDFSLSIE